jgi:hypothetical protein
MGNLRGLEYFYKEVEKWTEIWGGKCRQPSDNVSTHSKFPPGTREREMNMQGQILFHMSWKTFRDFK